MTVTTLAIVLALVASGPGKELLTSIEDSGSPAEVAAAQKHAHSPDWLLIALGTQLLAAALGAHRWLRPGDDPAHRFAAPLRWVLLAAAAATIATAVIVILAAHDATALHGASGAL